jgi:hypothetical protein
MILYYIILYYIILYYIILYYIILYYVYPILPLSNISRFLLVLRAGPTKAAYTRFLWPNFPSFWTLEIYFTIGFLSTEFIRSRLNRRTYYKVEMDTHARTQKHTSHHTHIHHTHSHTHTATHNTHTHTHAPHIHIHIHTHPHTHTPHTHTHTHTTPTHTHAFTHIRTHPHTTHTHIHTFTCHLKQLKKSNK